MLISSNEGKKKVSSAIEAFVVNYVKVFGKYLQVLFILICKQKNHFLLVSWDFNEILVIFVDLVQEKSSFCIICATCEYKVGFIFNYIWAEFTESFFSYNGRLTVSSFFNSKAMVAKPQFGQCSSMRSVFNKWKVFLVCYVCFVCFVGECF